MTNGSTTTAKTRLRKKRVPLMNLDRRHYAALQERELKFLSRLAVLTKNGTQPCNYSNAQAKKEFGVNDKTTQRTIAYLKKMKLIEVHMDYNLQSQRGYKIRTITLTAPAVVYTKEAKNA